MIIIVTVYKSTNYGSFLQARMLYKYLSTYDEVRFLDSGQRHVFNLKIVKQIFNALVFRFDWKYAVIKLQQIALFRKNWAQLPSISLPEVNSIDNPRFILGSDEIWNISKKKNRTHLFWGEGLNGEIISYAATINNADSMQLQNFGVKGYLSRMKMISVRDKYSQSVLSSFTQRPITITLDPTLLFDYGHYLSNITYKKLNFRYIALYLYTGNKKDIYEDTVKRFAAENDLKIVSVGTYVHWADVIIGGKESGVNPFLYFFDAEYVITNTFHGTAFAINFDKKFISFSRNNKIRDLLHLFNLDDRDALGKDENTIFSILRSSINYCEVNMIKNAMRKKSYKYIKHIATKTL